MSSLCVLYHYKFQNTCVWCRAFASYQLKFSIVYNVTVLLSYVDEGFTLRTSTHGIISLTCSSHMYLLASDDKVSFPVKYFSLFISNITSLKLMVFLLA